MRNFSGGRRRKFFGEMIRDLRESKGITIKELLEVARPLEQDEDGKPLSAADGGKQDRIELDPDVLRAVERFEAPALNSAHIPLLVRGFKRLGVHASAETLNACRTAEDGYVIFPKSGPARRFIYLVIRVLETEDQIREKAKTDPSLQGVSVVAAATAAIESAMDVMAGLQKRRPELVDSIEGDPSETEPTPSA